MPAASRSTAAIDSTELPLFVPADRTDRLAKPARSAAVALMRGRFGWDDYDLLGHPDADALADRVDTWRDETLEGLPHPFGATLAVEAGGARHALRIADPSGEPETFPDAAALAARFDALAGPVLNAGAAALRQRLAALPDAASVRRHLAHS